MRTDRIEHHLYLSRRGLLIGGVAMMLPAGAALANGGDSSAERNRRGSNTGSRTRSGGRGTMSQSQLVRLSESQVAKLNNVPRERRPALEGFSDNMRDRILIGMVGDRPRMQRLVRDMNGLTDPGQRPFRLRREIEEARKLERLFNQSIDRLFAIENRNLGQNQALNDYRSRLGRTFDFRDAVEAWAEYPREGTL